MEYVPIDETNRERVNELEFCCCETFPDLTAAIFYTAALIAVIVQQFVLFSF